MLNFYLSSESNYNLKLKELLEFLIFYHFLK